MSEFLTVQEAALRAHRTVDQVRYALRLGLIPGAEKFGQVWAIPAEAIEVIKQKTEQLAHQAI